MNDLKPKIQTTVCSSIVTRDTVLDGNYEGKTDLCIAGKIKGDVKLKGLVFIDETGVVEGSVLARDAVVIGEIKGNLVADNAVEIRKGGTVGGYVVAREIHLVPGTNVAGEIFAAKKGPFFFNIRVDAGENSK